MSIRKNVSIKFIKTTMSNGILSNLLSSILPSDLLPEEAHKKQNVKIKRIKDIIEAQLEVVSEIDHVEI